MNISRGAFIVFEGIDRSGKSTQCKKLFEYLQTKNIPVTHMHFPNRTTPTGKLINEYLQGNEKLDNHTIHLLFSANRWEFSNEIKKKLLGGETIICDRYSFSGVAYTAAKAGMDLEWCKYPEIGLPKPDLVFFLEVDEQKQIQRPGYGDEVYEKPIFQKKVLNAYKQLIDSDYWKVIDVNQSINEIHETVTKLTEELLLKVESKPIFTLW